MTNKIDMSEVDERDLSELDRLLNDPDVPMQAARVWELLDKVATPPAQSVSD